MADDGRAARDEASGDGDAPTPVGDGGTAGAAPRAPGSARRRRQLVTGLAALLAVVGAVLVFLAFRGDFRGDDGPERRAFSTRDGAIYDPDGRPFLPMGINEFAGPTYLYWTAPIASPEAVTNYVEGWRFNALRIVTCPNGECLSHIGIEQGEDLHAVIDAYTSRKVVIILDYHGLNFAEDPPTPEQVDEALVWYREFATRYRDNPYVWFETYNEPCDYYSGSCDDFAEYIERTIEGIREANPDATIVVCTGQYGQDRVEVGGLPDEEDSIILRYGPEWQERYGNLVWDLHVYDRWAETTPEQMLEFFRRVQSAGVSVLVGETWGVPGGGSGDERGLGWQGSSNLYESRAPAVGILGWSAYYINPVEDGRAYEIDDLENPTNLTEVGRTHWSWTHDPPPAEP